MFSNEVIASFNELETSIYNYISKNSEKVAYMRIRELAEETHVSTATILRFCRKVNCEGFSEFKTKLKLQIDQSKDKSKPFKGVQHSIVEFFERTLAGDIDKKMTDAANLVGAADNVVFIGNGSSGILAEYGARYFSSLGKFSTYIKDFSYPIDSKPRQNSVAIVLSVSGENPYIVSQLNKLKQEGTKIVSITNNRLSSIAKISDLNIAYYISEEFNKHANITTQVPVVYILETIAREIHNL